MNTEDILLQIEKASTSERKKDVSTYISDQQSYPDIIRMSREELRKQALRGHTLTSDMEHRKLDVETGSVLDDLAGLPQLKRQLLEDSTLRVDLDEETATVLCIIKMRDPEYGRGKENFFWLDEKFGQRIPLTEREMDEKLGLYNPESEDIYDLCEREDEEEGGEDDDEEEGEEVFFLESEYSTPHDRWDTIFNAHEAHNSLRALQQRDKYIPQDEMREVRVEWKEKVFLNLETLKKEKKKVSTTYSIKRLPPHWEEMTPFEKIKHTEKVVREAHLQTREEPSLWDQMEPLEREGKMKQLIESVYSADFFPTMPSRKLTTRTKKACQWVRENMGSLTPKRLGQLCGFSVRGRVDRTVGPRLDKTYLKIEEMERKGFKVEASKMKLRRIEMMKDFFRHPLREQLRQAEAFQKAAKTYSKAEAQELREDEKVREIDKEVSILLVQVGSLISGDTPWPGSKEGGCRYSDPLTSSEKRELWEFYYRLKMEKMGSCPIPFWKYRIMQMAILEREAIKEEKKHNLLEAVRCLHKLRVLSKDDKRSMSQLARLYDELGDYKLASRAAVLWTKSLPFSTRELGEALTQYYQNLIAEGKSTPLSDPSVGIEAEKVQRRFIYQLYNIEL